MKSKDKKAANPPMPLEVKRRKLFLLFVVIAVLITAWKAYKNYSNKLISISPELKEISGLEFDRNGDLWAINDGGNSPELHLINTLGQVSRSIKISNAKNVDWEDMTQDDFGHFFIGDFGNNKNDRDDLTVYKIENPADIRGTDTEAEIIKFKFSDQDLSEKVDSLKNFDMEAFVFYKGRLYLFTKNRTKPFDGYTNLYRMEDYASNQKAQMISRLKICQSGKFQCWITSAAMSPNGAKLALLGSSKVWIFSHWENDDFFSGELQEIDLGMMTQKEALTFYNDSTLVIADEIFKGIGGNIYRLKLK